MKKTPARKKKFVAALGLHLLSHRLDVTAETYERAGEKKTAYEVDKINHLLRKAMEDEELFGELENSDGSVADTLEQALELGEEQQVLLEEALYGHTEEEAEEEAEEEIEDEVGEEDFPPEVAEEVMEEAGDEGESEEVMVASKKTPKPIQAKSEPDSEDIKARIARAKARASARIAALRHRRPSIEGETPQPKRTSYHVPPAEQDGEPPARRLRVKTLR